MKTFFFNPENSVVMGGANLLPHPPDRSRIMTVND
jgi:hypothetical protein